MNLRKVLFFAGKNTPLKRYFKKSLELLDKDTHTDTRVVDTTPILCHSRGLYDAIEYCKLHHIKTIRIIAMDGVQVNSIPIGIQVVLFRPECKRDMNDTHMYYKVIYYKASEHYPYMDRKIRNQIVKSVFVTLRFIPRDIIKLIMHQRFLAMASIKLKQIIASPGKSWIFSRKSAVNPWCVANRIIMQSHSVWSHPLKALFCCHCDNCFKWLTTV